MSNSTRRGLYLLAGCILTLIWIFVCPGYTVQGQVITLSTYSTPSGPGWTYKDHAHLDIGEFIGGLVVIWSALGAIYCLQPSLVSAIVGAYSTHPTISPMPAESEPMDQTDRKE